MADLQEENKKEQEASLEDSEKENVSSKIEVLSCNIDLHCKAFSTKLKIVTYIYFCT